MISVSAERQRESLPPTDLLIVANVFRIGGVFRVDEAEEDVNRVFYSV